MKNWRLYLVLLILIGGAVGAYVASGRKGKPAVAPLIGENIKPSDNRSHLSAGQTTPEPYNSKPATSGPHNVTRLTYGIKAQELPDEDIVHGLEHGGIAFWYNSKTLTPAEIEQLTAFFRALPDGPEPGNPKGYLVPRSDLDGDIKVAAVSWGYLLKQKTINTDELKTFYTGHLAKGPELAP